MTYKIMIVDDQQVNLLLLGKTLSNHGFEVCTALTGVQCLDIVHIETPDLIILDIDMPELDGYETCARLHDDPETEDTPVFFLSALAKDIRLLNEDQDDRADEYLAKPVGQKDLIRRIETVLSFRYADQDL